MKIDPILVFVWNSETPVAWPGSVELFYFQRFCNILDSTKNGQ